MQIYSHALKKIYIYNLAFLKFKMNVLPVFKYTRSVQNISSHVKQRHLLKKIHSTRNIVHRTRMPQSPSKQAAWDLTQFSQCLFHCSRGMFKLNAKFDADSLLYLLSHFECDSHTVHMVTQGRLLPPLTSTVKLSLFTHAHSSPLSLAARLNGCCANHSRYINSGWTFPGS